MPRASSSSKNNSSATLGFEAKLWLAADSRSEAETAEGNRSRNMDAQRKDDDARWQFGLPPRGNANFALLPLPHSDFRTRRLTCLAPTAMAGFVLANGSMSSNQSGEGEIRRAIIEADLVDSGYL